LNNVRDEADVGRSFHLRDFGRCQIGGKGIDRVECPNAVRADLICVAEHSQRSFARRRACGHEISLAGLS
ncbi:MAG TPA: hypothetical protein VKU62_12555, partial [Thermoanaerobaculia bacterium]|nr:hypothetical protein [Thermoanaerobaculia bacterium]